MASENGIAVEDDSIVVENSNTKQSALVSKKEEQNSDECEKTMNENTESSENLDSSANNVEATEENATETKASKPIKGSITLDSGTPKISKTIKNKPALKQSGTFSRSPRFLSQSLSFPTRGTRADVIKKSVDGTAKKDVKNVLANGLKSKATAASGSASPRKASLASSSATEQNKTAVSAASDVAGGPSLEVSKLESESPKPGKAAGTSKDNEDARSTTTSTSTPRGRRSSAGSGFSFKLDERAENRKKFFSKLEEKIQAKEIEKNNLQAKSKENQEEEIKKLRKSLTFKAAPMPTFYKEPPPKVELKKIPTTRPLSPKLGRKKSNPDAVKSSKASETDSCSSPRINREENNSAKGVNEAKGLVASKKHIAKSQPKLQTRATSATKKTETKPVNPKPKKIEPSGQTQKENAEKQAQNTSLNACNPEEEEEKTTLNASKPEEEQNPPLNISIPEVSRVPEKIPNENEATSSSIANPEIMPSEVAVGC